jgi:hypothetical protein
MRWITGWETSEEQVGDHMLFTSERQAGPASSVQALINTNTGMEIVEIAEKNLLDNKVEVMKT